MPESQGVDARSQRSAHSRACFVVPLVSAIRIANGLRRARLHWRGGRVCVGGCARVGANRQDPIAVVQEDIPVSYRASRHTIVVVEKDIPISDGSERHLSVAAI